MKRSLEVADIFRSHGALYREVHGHEMPLRQLRAMRAIEICRSAELGGHVDECDHCGAVRISYNSCRNRHCPKCQCLNKERWLEARKEELLPTQYFHVVFTMPEPLRPLALRNQKIFYDLFFKAVSETLKELSRDPQHLGAEIGFIAILHTWSQTLMDHPHIHCIVTGGGLSSDGKRWITCTKGFFIRVEVLSRLLRGKLLHFLREAYDSGSFNFPGNIQHLKEKKRFTQLLTTLYHQEWVVYCKPTFKSAETVIEYLGRYTHRVALSNERLVMSKGDTVSFRYRDRHDNDAIKVVTLDVSEFIRRFLLHILPDGFMKIRHYGILSNRNRKKKLPRCKKLLGVPDEGNNPAGHRESWQELLFRITGRDPRICPYCGKGTMVVKEVLSASALLPLPP
jgi:hypothetical protein